MQLVPNNCNRQCAPYIFRYSIQGSFVFLRADLRAFAAASRRVAVDYRLADIPVLRPAVVAQVHFDGHSIHSLNWAWTGLDEPAYPDTGFKDTLSNCHAITGYHFDYENVGIHSAVCQHFQDVFVRQNNVKGRDASCQSQICRLLRSGVYRYDVHFSSSHLPRSCFNSSAFLFSVSIGVGIGFGAKAFDPALILAFTSSVTCGIGAGGA